MHDWCLWFTLWWFTKHGIGIFQRDTPHFVHFGNKIIIIIKIWTKKLKIRVCYQTMKFCKQFQCGFWVIFCTTQKCNVDFHWLCLKFVIIVWLMSLKWMLKKHVHACTICVKIDVHRALYNVNRPNLLCKELELRCRPIEHVEHVKTFQLSWFQLWKQEVLYF